MVGRRSIATFVALLGVASGGAAGEGGEEFFEKHIRPVLAEQCYSCHSASAEKLKASLRVDSREALLKGGDTGAALVPGDAEASLLVRAIRYDDPDLQMPPRSRLSSETVGHFREWITAGAPWPENDHEVVESDRGAGRDEGGFDLTRRRDEHWAWQPVRRPAIPVVRDSEWAHSEVDRFILARLEEEGLRPAQRASRTARIRRASFALTGLPPTVAEVEAYLGDSSASPEADARLIDELLASPHFGERWARHWLDKVRYAETMGHEFDYPIEGAWRYRDYVVRAFNGDVPFDRFAREQIAGDLDAVPRRAEDGTDEGRLATAQFWLCQQVHSPVDARQHQAEVIDNQIDVLTKAFLGMTVSCARCHDHKFDAVSARDYYALYGILESSRFALLSVDNPEPRREQAEELMTLRRRIREDAAEALAGSASRVPEGKEAQGVLRLEAREGDRRLELGEWLADGEAFYEETSARGQPLILSRTNLSVALPGWRHSAGVSRRLQGALRSPTFVIDTDYLHLWLAGEGTRFTVAVEGFTLVRAPIYGGLRREIRGVEPHWVTVDMSMWRGRRAWIELADFSVPDPASSLPAGSASPEGWFAIGAAVLSSGKEPPGARGRLWEGDREDVVRRWSRDPGGLDDAEVWAIAAWLRDLDSPVSDDGWAAWTAVESSIAAPVLVAAMTEGTGVEERVFIRGNHRMPGETVPRRFLEAVSGGPPVTSYLEGTGRRALAEAVTDPENPLFDRVVVNWVWAHLFGRGLVASVDNLGVLGERPSHPELLDWLAHEFRREGRSVKRLIRSLMLTETWRMSSRLADADAAAQEKDPANVLLHRARLQRLEGETIRDAILAVSGTLDRTVGGPPVAIHLTPFMDGRGRPARSGPQDGNGRRSLYVEVRRNFLSPMMLAFDAPVPSTTVGRRTVSNVPAQALALMNDPLVQGQSRRWAEKTLKECAVGEGVDGRLHRLFLEAFARPPTAGEREDAVAFLSGGMASGGAVDADVWGEFCHALLNTKEFVFIE